MAFKDVLMPTDFGAGSQAALRQALNSMGPEGGRVVVLHVLDQRLIDSIEALFSETKKEELIARLRRQAHEQRREVGGERRRLYDCNVA